MRTLVFERRPGSLALLVVTFLVFLIAPSATRSQCGNADGTPPASSADISDLTTIASYLYFLTPIPDYANAEVDGYEDVTVSDYAFMSNRLFCDSLNIFNRCIPLAPPLTPGTRSGDYMWVDRGIYPRTYGTPGTFYFNISLKAVDTLQGFTFPFQVRIGDSLVPILSVVNTDSLLGNPLQRFCRIDSLHAMVSGFVTNPMACYAPPGTYFLARVGVKGPYSNHDLPFLVEWAPYPTPVNPNTLQPVHRPIMVLKSYSAVPPPGPMTTVIAVTPTIQHLMQCLPCMGAVAYGPAVLSDSALTLIVDSIGSDGTGGVSLAVNNTSAHQLKIAQDLTVVGAEMTVAMRGSLLGMNMGSAPIPLSGWKLVNASGTLNLSSDFSPIGAPSVAFSIYRGDTLAYSATPASGSNLCSVSATDLSIPVAYYLTLSRSQTLNFLIVFDRPCLITVAGGETFQGNNVRLIGVAPTKTIWSLDSWLLTGKNTRFVIRDKWDALPLSECCYSTTGNIDCDTGRQVDIADITTLVDFLYVNFPVLCCPQAADCDGAPGVDIGDLIALVNYLYITFTPPAYCKF